ncbi:MAG: hypothetical protein IKD70_06795 [Eggerthellaceae bacterium]|nr:hypothetical protein [Eggerthellaceae bacterium]
MEPIRKVLRDLRTRWAGTEGQSTIELAFALPVMMLAALIAYNALMFLGDCATFDRVFRDAVRVFAADELFAVSGDASARIQAAVQSQLGEGCRVEVSSGMGAKGFTVYTGTLTFTPTVFGRELRGEVFGMSLAKPRHRASLTIDTLVTG